MDEINAGGTRHNEEISVDATAAINEVEAIDGVFNLDSPRVVSLRLDKESGGYALTMMIADHGELMFSDGERIPYENRFITLYLSEGSALELAAKIQKGASR